VRGPATFTHRARLARREAAIARSQSRVHVREAARAEAEIEAIRAKLRPGVRAVARDSDGETNDSRHYVISRMTLRR
jgi:hypothetical protein